jgi:hypothetical protein
MKKLLGMLLVLMPLVAVAQSGIDGTWRIDVNKAKIDPKPRVFELKDGVYSCSTCESKDKVKADGQDHKITGDPYLDTQKISVVSGSTIEQVGKKDGKVSFRATLTTSTDGKMLTEKFEYHPAGSDQVASGTEIYSRVGDPEAGAHAISGSWKTEKYETMSDNALTFVYAPDGDGLKFKASTGENYSAKFDGKDYPFQGDPGTTAVVLKKIDDQTFEETYKRKGEVVGVARMTISPDGKSLTIVSEDKVRGRTDNWIAEKQGAGNQEASK